MADKIVPACMNKKLVIHKGRYRRVEDVQGKPKKAEPVDRAGRVMEDDEGNPIPVEDREDG